MTIIEGGAEVDRLGRLLVLAGREARRLARHPALWLPLAVAVAGMVNLAVTSNRNFGAGSQYVYLFFTVAILGPMVAIVAANLVTSDARRIRAEEMLGVTPTSDTERTLAMCLGVALALCGVGAAGVVAMSLVAADGAVGAEAQNAGELAQIPPIVAGGGLLGVLTARWLHFPGAVLVTFAGFALVGVITLPGMDIETDAWWFRWSSTSTPVLYEGPEPAGDPWWHAAYLVGLCACVTVAAVYRDRGQWPKLAAVGLPVAAVTVVFGLLQLP